MQHSTRKRRRALRAALVLAAGLGPAFALPAVATASIYVDPAGLAREDRAAIQRLVVAEAIGNGTVPAPLALAVVDVESGFVPRTVGASGAIGLMQILPATATGELGTAADALWDPATNVRLGLGRLAGLHDRYGGDWALALSHHRGGELAQEDGRYLAHDYTRAYVERVMDCWRRYQRDRLVRAWIREASGAPRFVAGDTAWYAPRYTDRVAVRDRTIRWHSADGGRDPHHHYRARHRVHDRRAAEGCDERVTEGGRFRGHPGPWYRFHTGGRWSAVEGGPAPRFRTGGGGRWVAVTGGPRFR